MDLQPDVIPKDILKKPDNFHKYILFKPNVQDLMKLDIIPKMVLANPNIF